MTYYSPREIMPRLIKALERLPDAQLTYWNEQGRHEVDFVIEYKRKVVAVEVKAATRWNAGDLSGLCAFMERTSTCAAAVLAYNGRDAVNSKTNCS